MFGVKAGAYLGVEHLKGASLEKAPTLHASIRLDWKGLPGTNTLAFIPEQAFAAKPNAYCLRVRPVASIG